MLVQLRRLVVIFFRDMDLLDTPLHRLVSPFDLVTLLPALFPKHCQ
jgi:hypothetical protein